MLNCSSQLSHVLKRSLHTSKGLNSLWVWGLRSSLPPVRKNAEAILRPTEISGTTALWQVCTNDLKRDRTMIISLQGTSLLNRGKEFLVSLLDGVIV